ncbi:MAG: glutamate-5-semialdehyde dehydrogenase [Saprospiraceae bacterium]|nr:glutamate-5-semialdehyde dehydrogenase [Saprospiraceae bacterium]
MSRATKSKKFSFQLASISEESRTEILHKIADAAITHIAPLLAANLEDLKRMDTEDPKYDRLLLTPERIRIISDQIRQVATLESPLGKVLSEYQRPDGLLISRITVPLGVVGIIFESRPNVTFDVVALCLKSGNACVLKGSRDAHFSNIEIVRVIQEVLIKYGLENSVYLAPSEREMLQPILDARGLIDVIIPRGSQSLIEHVRLHSKVPTIETGAGIVHTYVDKSADLNKAARIIVNAKARRVSVCNALDCLIIHEEILDNLYRIIERLDTEFNTEIFADNNSYSALKGKYRDQFLHESTESDYGREFLSYKMSIKTVANVEEAIEHIHEYSSGHSEAIITEDKEQADMFVDRIDAACVYVNASTAFSDGAEFGLGAEIGISTQKLHARGPMALEALTTYKWIGRGDGQVRDEISEGSRV